ncbi:DUF6894 family protein [uncultured Methylobacterium sp.]|uniref:DUF6894 family protein n=1 Tax=uncultured Methylobacterium sp. TaxID=157278 RepID=UPI0035CAC8AC
MPRYFIDTDDGDTHVHDDEGRVLPDDAAARLAAQAALPDMARDKLPGGDARNLVAMVRNETGDLLYTVTMALVGAWKVSPPA